MDLEGEFVEDNEATEQAIPLVDDNNMEDKQGDDCKLNDNESCANDNETLRFPADQSIPSNALPDHNHLKDAIELAQQIHTSSSPSKSPFGTSPPTTKGYGLKKWRRIKRDFVKEATTSADSSKILKRGLPAPTFAAKPQHLASSEIKQNSDGPVVPENLLTNASIGQGFTARSPSSDSRFAIGAAASAATDSENSEDQSSKSSTAASLPKLRHDLPAISSFMHERNQIKNLSGKSLGNSSQRVQLGKGRVETSKKHRGERVKIEKENSHSSMESDSRSSNFVFMQGSSSLTSNGKPSGKSMNYDGENSDDAHEGENGFGEVRAAYRKENSGEIEELSPDCLSWEDKDKGIDNHEPVPDQDPLIESLNALQSVHETLEKELQKLGEIGKEPTFVTDNHVKVNNGSMDSSFADPDIQESSSSERLASEKIPKAYTSSLESQVFTLTQKAKYLESKLEEARTVLQAKDLRIFELESNEKSRLPKEEFGSTAELPHDKYRETEFELEGLFQQKLEAEVEFLALTEGVQQLKVSVGNQITLFEEQKSLVREQSQMINKLGEAESKAAMLKKQAEELQNSCGDFLGTEEVVMMQGRLCKITSCFLIQLVLLVLVFCYVILQLSSNSGVIVPT